MMNTEKICPVMTSDSADDPAVPCCRESCAWWIKPQYRGGPGQAPTALPGRCAVYELAEQNIRRENREAELAAVGAANTNGGGAGIIDR